MKGLEPPSILKPPFKRNLFCFCFLRLQHRLAYPGEFPYNMDRAADQLERLARGDFHREPPCAVGLFLGTLSLCGIPGLVLLFIGGVERVAPTVVNSLPKGKTFFETKLLGEFIIGLSGGLGDLCFFYWADCAQVVWAGPYGWPSRRCAKTDGCWSESSFSSARFWVCKMVYFQGVHLPEIINYNCEGSRFQESHHAILIKRNSLVGSRG